MFRYSLTIALLVWQLNLFGQGASNASLEREILVLDSLLFEEAFNQCKLSVLQAIVAADLEFYHDQAGITHGRKAFIEGLRNNICALDYRPERRLIDSTHAVYPLFHKGEIYGLIQNGSHEFWAHEKNREPYQTSVAKFSNLWLLENERWLLKRVFSFDHQAVVE